jgi:predicted Fe-Mo cluster-binding NifX family protein
MKLAFSSTGKDLDSEIDPRFGRCAYFLVVDLDDMSFEAVENESMSLGGGAGIQSGQFIANTGASVLLTGNVGPNASRTLNAAGIEVIVGVNGTIREIIERYKRGELSRTDQANVPDHFGMGGGQSPYAGGGMGRGMGRGQGRGQGMGRGMGMGQGYGPIQDPPASSHGNEMESLKQEAKSLRDQLNSILSRIEELEGK